MNKILYQYPLDSKTGLKEFHLCHEIFGMFPYKNLSTDSSIILVILYTIWTFLGIVYKTSS